MEGSREGVGVRRRNDAARLAMVAVRRKDMGGSKKKSAGKPSEKKKPTQYPNETKRRAVDMLTILGMKSEDAAEALGVKVSAIQRWLLRDPLVRPAVRAWRASHGDTEATHEERAEAVARLFGRRVLKDPDGFELRDLVAVYDRLMRLASKTEGRPENAEENEDDEISSEEAERIWQEVARELGEPGQPGKPGESAGPEAPAPGDKS